MQKNIESNIIKKVRKESEFAQISNELINNRLLSYKALGILTYILSKPDDWQVYMSDLVRDADGEKSVRAGLKELIDQKYVQRYRVYNKDTGKVHHWETLVSETPFSDDELISSIKESYALDSEGKAIHQKITFGSFVRYVPIVVNREITLLCQKGKVEKNSDEFSTSPKPTSRKPTSTKCRTTNTNITNTDLTNTDSNNSNKGTTPDSDYLVELFNNSITQLKKTTLPKFRNYINNYDSKFIEAVIAYCESQGDKAKSYRYFEITIDSYISKGILTAEALELDIEKFRESNKQAKNRALKDKDEAKKSEEFDLAMDNKAIDEMVATVEGLGVAIDTTDAKDIDFIKDTIRPYMTSEITFNAWIERANFKIKNDVVVVVCENEFSAGIVAKRYGIAIASALRVLEIEYSRIEYTTPN